MGPEVYVGRIYAYSLNYDTEEKMVNDYLKKIHSYRTGNLVQGWKSLEYIDEDWYNMDVYLRYIYGEDVNRFSSGFNTTAEGYLEQIDLGQHFVQVGAHSYSGGHHFSTRPTESSSYAHTYIYSPTTRPAKILMGSDDGIIAILVGIILVLAPLSHQVMHTHIFTVQQLVRQKYLWEVMMV